MGKDETARYQGRSGWLAGALGSPPENRAYRSELEDAVWAHKNGSACDVNGCRHREILRHTLADAIEVLESTRKAFKSKQIEALRKKLTKVLIEES
jgi:hypothetical protein